MNETHEFRDFFVPMELWGRDHWSTLAYIETVETNMTEIIVRSDPRMRQNRHNYRVLGGRPPAIPMRVDQGSLLSDGRMAIGHDDWSCIQDFASVGLLNCGPDGVDVGQRIKLSEKGRAMAASLRAHKAGGGSFSTFKPELA